MEEEPQRERHAAFRRLFDAHHERVYNLALRFSGDAAAAQDVAQAAFIKLYRHMAPKGLQCGM